MFALNNGGVLNPVTFHVRPGTYQEQVSIRSFPGNTQGHSVAFTSEAGDSTSVTLQFNAPASDNYLVRVNGARNIKWSNMTFRTTSTIYGRIFVLENGAHDFELSGSILNGSPTNSTSTNHSLVFSGSTTDNNTTIVNNIFEGGAEAIRLMGGGETGHVILGNRFLNQYSKGAYLSSQSAPQLMGNSISTTSGYSAYRGIEFSQVSNNALVSANRVSSPAGTGLYLSSSNGTSAQRITLVNNFFHGGGNSSSYGMYLASSSFINIYFNSVNVTGSPSPNVTGLYVTSGSNINLRNNNLVAMGGSYAVYIPTTAAISSSDFNNLYTTGANLGFWNDNITSLANWRSASGQDMNSISIDPLYYLDSDLHASQVGLIGVAAPIAGITTDIDGDQRDPVNPCIGADEFTPSPDDIGVTQIISPSTGCRLTASEEITVRIQNFGSVAQSGFDVSYVLNGQTFTENTGSLTIQPGTGLDYTFTSTVDLTEVKTHTLSAFTQLTGDQVSENDGFGPVNIIHRPDPVYTKSPDQTICEGDSKVLAASGATSYQWSTGSTASYITVSPAVDEVYGLTVANAFGCTVSDSILVTVLPRPDIPNVTISGNTTLCQGETLTLTSDIATNIVWSNEETTPAITVRDAGQYFVQHIAPNG